MIRSVIHRILQRAIYQLERARSQALGFATHLWLGDEELHQRVDRAPFMRSHSALTGDGFGRLIAVQVRVHRRHGRATGIGDSAKGRNA